MCGAHTRSAQTGGKVCVPMSEFLEFKFWRDSLPACPPMQLSEYWYYDVVRNIAHACLS